MTEATHSEVLLTGFEPFDGASLNPSAEIARALDGTHIHGRAVRGLVLACRFGVALTRLRRIVRARRPVLVVCVGQAGGRAEITPERVAINLNDATIPDNAGRQPRDTPVVRGGPPAYFSTLPVKAIVEGLRGTGTPAAVSLSAGAFVCNHVFYGLMHELRDLRGVRGGFIHVPWLPEQAPEGQPALPLEQQIGGIRTAIAVSLEHAKPVQRS